MQVLVTGSGHNSKCLAINGQKLLKLLGLSEDNLTAEMVAEKLFNLSEEERENLFNECAIFSRSELLDVLGDELRVETNLPTLTPEMLSFSQFGRDFFIPAPEDYFERTPEVIKKELKYEKNPMRIRQLNQELTCAYKSLKGRW